MPYTFTLTKTIPATAQEIYEAWLDSLSHSEMTGGTAKMSDQVGDEVSAWDDYISGRNLELVPGERIVQTWRTSEFGDEDEDSIITVTLEETDEGTLLTLEHSNVPDEQRSYEEGGWQENYFEPMVAYFTERAREPAAPEMPEAEAPQPTAKAPKRAAKSTPKRARKAKRAAAKSKRAAPRAKVSVKRKAKTRRAGAASKMRARRKPAARKPARGKRR